jgi:(p)ppGpp synthase/HD superfamily hydrolase
MVKTFESALGNLLEALRFTADRYGPHLHPDGLPMLAHLIEVLGVLWHVVEVRNQHVLLAGLLFRMPGDGVATEAELRGVFGEQATSYVQRASDLSTLQPQALQRLRFSADQRSLEAARQIRLAEVAVCLRRRPTEYIFPPEVHVLRSTVPALDAYFRSLEQPS